ncbi:PEP-CTERM sorting domain-containing protein [Pacificimonas sp. WHA3]|uniref:PEP-CTERM sorting domain-containing protein n=1 Tax=Pacificimonas pallii TaxID=2827236 RepID=A0ABS6SDD3_9SPHN|nr:PEP-CTERM sorting domain-containing protein [Pacificimonas pallii]MBV7256384.1 PEP-CTERM sorting domain-containing protein [Pacificimonas pallii]
MYKLTSTFIAASMALAAAGGASAAVIPLDGFDTPFAPNPLATTAGTVVSMTVITPGGNVFDRTTTLTVDSNSNGAPSGANVRTDSGDAVLSNDTGVASVLTFSYDVDGVVNDAQTGSATGSLRIVEKFADRPRTYTFSLNGIEQDTNVQLIDTEFGFAREIFLSFSTALLTGDDTFALEIDAGAAGVSLGDALDLEIALLDIIIPEIPPQVPAPGALGLLGLGALALGAARRRKAT